MVKPSKPSAEAKFKDTFTCESGSSCSVVFAASIGGGEPVWSDVITFGASHVTISAPERRITLGENRLVILVSCRR